MLITLVTNLVIIKYKECIKLMQRQLMSVSQKTIKAIIF